METVMRFKLINFRYFDTNEEVVERERPGVLFCAENQVVRIEYTWINVDGERISVMLPHYSWVPKAKG
ncbi:unnamed protein product [Rhodiola kirilowii]